VTAVPDPDTVHVWLIATDLPAPRVASLRALLDAEERDRAGALRHGPDRRRFTVAHAAARLVVAGYLDTAPERIRWDRGPAGKPELAGPGTDLHANLSHSGDLTVLAVTGSRRVGVDVQRLRPDRHAAALAVRFFPAAEAEFVRAGRVPAGPAGRFARLWTRKEACVKVAGGRLAQGLPLPVAGSGPGTGFGAGLGAGAGAGRVVVGRAAGPLPGPYLVTDLPVPPGFRAAVALSGTRPYRIVRHRWRPE
jgi:4'-phosphopantetheinyl transferase